MYVYGQHKYTLCNRDTADIWARYGKKQIIFNILLNNVRNIFRNLHQYGYVFTISH